ncbi:MAG: PTS sugar transporter subunit IIB [Brevinema sp.]
MSIKFLAACGSGLGSSLIVSMNVEKVIKELGIDGEVEHCDISSVTSMPADIYVLGRDVADSSAVQTISPDKIIALDNILSMSELTEKIKNKIQG